MGDRALNKVILCVMGRSEWCLPGNHHQLFPSVWPRTEYTWALIWKKSLIICLESYQGIPYLFPYSQSRQEFEHFANG